ncbi:Uncharacterised protein g6945 [Pycnogonum litorale]
MDERRNSLPRNDSGSGEVVTFSFITPNKKERISYTDSKNKMIRALQQHKWFDNGILFSTMEKGVTYPIIHFVNGDRISKDENNQMLPDNALGNTASLQQGVYTETRRIRCPTSSITRRPSYSSEFDQHFNGGRYDGPETCIFLGFKRLETYFNEVLEDSWADWTGSRFIYLNMNDDFGLENLRFFRKLSPKDINLFMYVVIAECSNVTKRNSLRLLDFVQRFRVDKMTGYLSAYKLTDRYDSLVDAINGIVIDGPYRNTSQDGRNHRSINSHSKIDSRTDRYRRPEENTGDGTKLRRDHASKLNAGADHLDDHQHSRYNDRQSPTYSKHNGHNGYSSAYDEDGHRRSDSYYNSAGDLAHHDRHDFKGNHLNREYGDREVENTRRDSKRIDHDPKHVVPDSKQDRRDSRNEDHNHSYGRKDAKFINHDSRYNGHESRRRYSHDGRYNASDSLRHDGSEARQGHDLEIRRFPKLSESQDSSRRVKYQNGRFEGRSDEEQDETTKYKRLFVSDRVKNHEDTKFGEVVTQNRIDKPIRKSFKVIK